MKELIGRIRNRASSSTVANFYSNEKLLANLECYFSYLSRQRVRYMLVGEAPGYKGCTRTGIPFTSQKILRNSENAFFKEARTHLHILGDQAENSATIVWKGIPNESTPLIWNSFPYHPHEDCNQDSNRKPNLMEIEEGLEILQNVVLLFTPKLVIAVGKSAEISLSRLKGDFIQGAVRHPSFGGVRKYQEGLDLLLSEVQV